MAEYYQMVHSLPGQMRIDVIAVTLSALDELEAIEHMENISGF